VPRLTLDSVNFSAVSATRWPHLIGYINGHVSAWSPGEIAETRADGRLLALVDVLGTQPLSASILDFERGDVQSPTVVRAWLQARNQFRGDGTVYCSASSIPAVVSGLRGERCNLWVADLTADGEPPFDVPDYPGLPAGVRVIARQFVLGPKSGGDYDMSVIYADDWHPEQQAPQHLAAAALAAAPELGRYAAPAAATVSAAQIPGQLTIGLPGGQEPEPDPKPADSPGGTTSSASLSAPDPAPAPVPVQDGASTSPATAAAAADTAGPDPAAVSAAMAAGDPAAWGAGPAPVTMATATAAADGTPRLIVPAAVDSIGNDYSSPAPTTAASSPSSTTLTPSSPGPAPLSLGLASVAADLGLPDPHDALFAEHELAASRRAVAAAAAPPGLNHDFIRNTLADVGQAAAMFRRGGWGNVAAELERVAGIAWEIGSALKVAGF